MIRTRTTHVVVDVQSGFEATKPAWLKLAVLREILLARVLGNPIVMLEFFAISPPKTFGNTYDELVCAAAANNSGNFTMRAKALEDGSERVQDACLKMGFPTNRFRICGVNTHACVRATVEGLSRTFPGCFIEVVTDACNDYRGNNWSIFPVVANACLV